MGNGRATVIRIAQEGAKVLCVDPRSRPRRRKPSRCAKETNAGECAAFEADVTRDASMKAMIDACKAKWGRIDVLHYNVGFSIAGGDAPPTEITEEAFDRILTVNLRGMVMAVKHVLPMMRPAAVRRDPRHLVARRVGEIPLRGLQDLEVRDGRVTASRSPFKTPNTASAATSSCPA